MKNTLTLIGMMLAASAAASALPVLQFNITIDTTGLNGGGSPYSFGVQFIDGGVLGNNSAVLSVFQFGGGSTGAVNGLTTTAIGNMGSTVTFDNSVFFGNFEQSFTPGTLLCFVLDLTNNFDGLTPDQFSLQLFSNGAQIQTTDPGGSFLYVDLTGAAPVFNTFGTSVALGGFDISAPVVAEGGKGGVSEVPEPSSFALLLGAVAVFEIARGRRRRSASHPAN